MKAKNLENGTWTNMETGGPSEELIRIFVMTLNVAKTLGIDFSHQNSERIAKEVAKILPIINLQKWGEISFDDLWVKIKMQFAFALALEDYQETDQSIKAKMIQPYFIANKAYKMALKRIK